MAKLESLYIAGENVEWYSHVEFLKKLNVELSHDLAILF